MQLSTLLMDLEVVCLGTAGRCNTSAIRMMSVTHPVRRICQACACTSSSATGASCCDISELAGHLAGTITVGLAQPLVVEQIYIEHSYALISPNMSSAPRLVQAWGHVERWDVEGTFLGEFVYVKEHNQTVQPRQTFAVGSDDDADGDERLAFNAVRLEVMANHGSQDYTCVYGIGVYGTPQSDL